MLLVIDNFLDQEDDLLFDIQHDRFWTEQLTFKFMDKDSEPVGVWQKMADKIWSHVSEYGVLPDDYAGVEYWNNIMSIPGKKQDLPWHFDKDEHLFAGGKGELRTPYIGSVYYAHKHLPKEGYLEIKRGDNDIDVERIQPVPNRLVIFDSGTVHRVTHIKRGLRRCFATNIWIDKPSEENFK